MTSGQPHEGTMSLTSLPLAARSLDTVLCENRIVLDVIKYEKRDVENCTGLPQSDTEERKKELGRLTPSEASVKPPRYAGSGPWPHSAGSYSILP